MLWSLNMLHWSRCADLRLHNGEIAYTSTIWESFTCCLILTVDSKPIKKAGCLVFPCCIAAISTAFDLKNASPLFLCLRWWWLTLQHTLQKSPLMHPRGRERRGERKRKKREGYFCLCACNTQCLFMCPDLPTPFTQIPVLICIPCSSLQGGNAAGVFALLECIMYFLDKPYLSATMEC